jgi:hypothetical protein
MTVEREQYDPFADPNTELRPDGTTRPRHGWTWVVVVAAVFALAGVALLTDSPVLLALAMIGLGLCAIVFNEQVAARFWMRDYSNPIDWFERERPRRVAAVVVGSVCVAGGAVALIGVLV